MSDLSRAQKRYLVSIAHGLKPVVMVGQNGLTDAVLAEVELALDSHELVKLKLRGDREERAQWIGQIAESTGADVVQKIGQVCCLYRRNAQKPVIELPRR